MTRVRHKSKDYAIHVAAEGPRVVAIYSFHVDDILMPVAAANECRLELAQDCPELKVQTFNEKELANYLRKAKKPVVRGKSKRRQNPRRSILKNALAIEALSYKDFEDFAKAYWESCARGIYWYPTDNKDFRLGPEEEKFSAQGRFFVYCNPELAFESSGGKDKKYAAELDTTALGSNDYRIQRGTSGAQIKLVRNLNKVKVLRVLRASKAMRSLIWQQSILPSSKEELRRFYNRVVEKDRAIKEKEKKKERIKSEGKKRREKFLAQERKSKIKKVKTKEELKEKIEQKKSKEKLSKKIRKQKAKQERRRAGQAHKERRSKKSSKGKSKKDKHATTALAKSNPGTRLISFWMN